MCFFNVGFMLVYCGGFMQADCVDVYFMEVKVPASSLHLPIWPWTLHQPATSPSSFPAVGSQANDDGAQADAERLLWAGC